MSGTFPKKTTKKNSSSKSNVALIQTEKGGTQTLRKLMYCLIASIRAWKSARAAFMFVIMEPTLPTMVANISTPTWRLNRKVHLLIPYNLKKNNVSDSYVLFLESGGKWQPHTWY